MANPRNRGPQWGTVLLGTQLMHVGLKNVPPVTLALIVGQTLVFMDTFPEVFPSPMDVCMSSYLVYHKQEWIRMIKGALCHGDDMHLYFNMLSLLYKGALLEKTYGSPYYAYMMTSFTGLTSATYVGLGLLLHKLTGDESYLKSCAVGFSGVLFAMKVLTTLASPPGIHYIGPIPVPSRYIFWVELVLIQMAAPNASFVGHLAGILVGLAYAWGPLKYLMDVFLPPSNFRHSVSGRHSSLSSRRWFSSSGASGYRLDGGRNSSLSSRRLFSSSGASGYRLDGGRRSFVHRVSGDSFANNYNDSRDPQYSPEDYRRNPTFETNSIFNREPPNLHENPRMSQPPPQPQRRSPQHRFDDQLGPGQSRNSAGYTRTNPSPPHSSSSYSHSGTNPRHSFSHAYGGTNPNSALYVSPSRVRPSAPYSSEAHSTSSSQSYNDKLYTGDLDEDEQLRLAVEESLRTWNQNVATTNTGT